MLKYPLPPPLFGALVFRVTGLKILGRVGAHFLFFFLEKKYNFMHA